MSTFAVRRTHALAVGISLALVSLTAANTTTAQQPATSSPGAQPAGASTEAEVRRRELPKGHVTLLKRSGQTEDSEQPPVGPTLEEMSPAAFSDEENAARRPGGGAKPMLCPNPTTIVLNAPPIATPFASDFPPLAPPFLTNQLNDPATDKHYRHTFQWKLPSNCCQFVSGGLQVSYRANGGNAGNDSVSLWKNGSSLGWQYLYPGAPSASIAAGTTGTKSFALTPAMVAGDRLSVQVQDDSAVTGAKIVIRYCCLGRSGPEPVDTMPPVSPR